MNKKIFEEEINQIDREIELVKRLDSVNNKLHKFNWIFLHPYSQGMDIEILRKLSLEENPEEKILAFYARKFLDLRTTIHFVEGFYKTRPFLKDYISSIRESVILCLQKDFKGAITVLIPVIEGTLRKYLISRKGEQKKHTIDIKELLKAIPILTDEYVERSKNGLKSRHKHSIEANNYLDFNQEKELLKRNRMYFELWMKQLKNYLENNLYLNTKHNEVQDSFNRHLIFHALEDNIEYSFANYLRLFNSLNFLSWAIGLTNDGCSVLSVANEDEVKSLWVDYLNILIASEALTETKSNIHEKDILSFKPYLDKAVINAIKRPEAIIKKGVKLHDFLKK
ncbi:MAG: hypothetical protein ABJO02_08000 [Reichenbachiella sp.]|uniref:hypothetical protein n=1 Tax=Reichenbachiella sp. TaxID=2184521 RepID=UPI0032975985